MPDTITSPQQAKEWAAERIHWLDSVQQVLPATIEDVIELKTDVNAIRDAIRERSAVVGAA